MEVLGAKFPEALSTSPSRPWADLVAGLAEVGLNAVDTNSAIALVEIATSEGTLLVGGAEGGLPRDRDGHTGWTVRLARPEAVSRAEAPIRRWDQRSNCCSTCCPAVDTSAA